MQVLELSAELDEVAFGEFDLAPDRFLGGAHVAFDVARVQVHHQRGAALAVVALDRFHGLEGGELDGLAKRQQAVVADAQRELSNLRVVGAQFFRHPHHNVEAAIALDNLADSLARQRGAHGPVHLAGL